MSKKPRILFYDLETSPLIGAAWGIYQVNLAKVIKHSEILSFSYKWSDEKITHTHRQCDYSGKGDYKLCRDLKKVLDSADILVGHNSVSFDNRVAKARFLKHRIRPTKPMSNVDTLKVARKEFRLTSNKLDDLAQFLGLGKKVKHHGIDLWLDCMAGEQDSWDLMGKYNAQDVRLLEKVYYKLRPWMTNHPSTSLLSGHKKNTGCPSCASKNVQRRGLRATHRELKQQMQCRDCFGWFLVPAKAKK